jgi:hypothetical protein
MVAPLTVPEAQQTPDVSTMCDELVAATAAILLVALETAESGSVDATPSKETP